MSTDTGSSKVVMANRVYEALYAAGVVQEHPNRVSRAIIDLSQGAPARIYIERFGEEKLIDVLLNAGLAEIPEAAVGE